MRGRTFSHRNDVEWNDMSSSYVQINIYDTNLKDLQDKGVDIKHLLQHIGFRSVVMDVPILGSAPLKFSVEASARRAKSFEGFLTHGRSYSKSVGSFGRPYSRAGNRLRHKALQKSPSTDNSAVNHNQDVMNTNLTTSVISSSTSLPKKESEDRAVPLTSTPLTSKRFISFGRFIGKPTRTTSEPVDTVFQRAADCYQNGQYDVHQATKHALQLKSNCSRTENLSNLDNKLLSKNITTATDVSVFQDSQEGLVETPVVDGYANASLSFESPRSPAINTAPCVESSPKIPLSSSTSPEEECFEGIGNFDGANIADQSFMSFSRVIVSGLQSINATPLSPLGDDVVCNQLNQQCWNSYSSSAKCELFPLNEDNSHEGIRSKGVCDLESENCIFGFVEINEENVCSSEVGRQSYVAGKGDVVEDIDGNQLLPHSSVKLEAQKLRETSSSSHLCSCEVVSLQNADLENGVFNEADGDLIIKSGASKRSLRRKRARPMSNESDKGGCKCSLAKSDRQTKIFRCQMPDCGKNILWRPRYGKNRLVDHVRIHWAKAVKQCKICGYKASSYRKIHYHHGKKHQNMPYIGAVSTETKEDLDELLMYWKQCFPDTSMWRSSTTLTTTVSLLDIHRG